MHFHSGKDQENVLIFPVHYDDDENGFVLPDEVIKDLHIIGKMGVNYIVSLPQVIENENKVYNTGKKFSSFVARVFLYV